jgi:hypothetical protein
VFWRALWKGSDLNQREYCEAQGIFSDEDKRRIMEEARRPGASLSAMALRYAIAAQELAATTAPAFVAVQISDTAPPSGAAPSHEEHVP